MSISLHPDLEARLRAAAETHGLTIEAYLELMVQCDQNTRHELEALAREGLNSGAPFAPSLEHWQEKHRSLDSRFKNSHEP